MKRTFSVPTHRTSVFTVIALVAATITCRDEPTRPLGPAVEPPNAESVALSSTSASAPITHTLLTSGNNVVNQDVYTTASISPGPNALVLVAVLGHRSSGANPSPVVTGGGMAAWEEVATVTLDPLTTPLKRLTVYRAMSATPGAGPITIRFQNAVSNAQWVVSQWDGVDVTGTNGAGAIAQVGSARADLASGLMVTLAPFGSANNVAYGAFAVRSGVPVVAPGAGFAEIAEHGSGESPASALQAEWSINDNTVDASWVNLHGAALAVEIKSAEPALPPPPPPPVSAALSTVTADPASIRASSGSSTITVTVKDESDAPISGATVVLSATGDGNTLTQPIGPTNTSGVATGTLSSTIAEVKTVSASANGTAITQTAAVEVTPPPAVSAAQSTVTADPTSIPATAGSSTITVTVMDESGAPMSGVTVELSATGDGNTLTQPAASTNASGVATGSLASTVPGIKTISATADGTVITQTAAVEVTDPPPPPTSHPIAHTLLTSGNNTANQRAHTTAPISPAPNTLITVAVLGHNSSSAAPSPTLSGGGMSAWTEVATVTFDALSKPLKRMTVYRAMSSSPGSGPITITFNKSQSNAQWIVSQWTGVDVSGTNGAGAIVQSASDRAEAVNGLALSLAPFGDQNNIAYGVFGIRSSVPAVNPGAGFMEIAEHGSAENPASALQAEWAPNDHTIDATWANHRGAVLGLEIKAGQHGGPAAPVVSVEVTPASASLLVGETVQLTATALNAEGEALPGRIATWSTDAPSVASVSSNGLVRAEGQGSATITATIEGKTGTSSITVTINTVPVASVEVTPATASVSVGTAVQLTATAKDAAGQPLSGRTFTWSTDAPSIATVSASGLVTGGAEGSATITATSEGRSGTSSVTVTAGGQLAQMGSWSSVLPAPMILVHAHLLLDGRVLIFGKDGVAQVWNPQTGVFTAAPAPALVFCAGHDWLPDGRLLVVGGHIEPSRGLAVTNIFDPATASWQAVQPMAQGRWYPSTTTLPNGEVIAIAGEDATGASVAIPEIWNGTSWRRLTGASLTMANYPRTFVAPDGRIFVAGSNRQTRFLDVSGTGQWTLGPQRLYGLRSYGAAVMYEPGKIMYVGGGSGSTLPTATAEIIDLNQTNPQWAWTGSLATARWNHNATLLPTGEVLVTAGVAGDRSNPALRVNTSEMWDPATGSWRTVASSATSLLRGYHSTSLLLPDGRVLHGGGGDGASTPDNLSYEVYSPPYLFRGARPAVTGATPGTVAYGQQLFVETPDGASITKVTLIRFGSVTHAFDWASRLVPLSYSQAAGGINVTMPASGTMAPPGPYMLFLVNANGVPSVGRIMLVR